MRQEKSARLSPGDIVAIETPRGTRHVQVTHQNPPYPDVLRAIEPNGATAPEDIAKGRTSFSAMVELAPVLESEEHSASLIGHATIPQADRTFPIFRVPIRNRAGEIVYWWYWDGEGLRVAPRSDDTALPVREVLPVETLRLRLAEMG